MTGHTLYKVCYSRWPYVNIYQIHFPTILISRPDVFNLKVSVSYSNYDKELFIIIDNYSLPGIYILLFYMTSFPHYYTIIQFFYCKIQWGEIDAVILATTIAASQVTIALVFGTHSATVLCGKHYCHEVLSSRGSRSVNLRGHFMLFHVPFQRCPCVYINEITKVFHSVFNKSRAVYSRNPL